MNEASLDSSFKWHFSMRSCLRSDAYMMDYFYTVQMYKISEYVEPKQTWQYVWAKILTETKGEVFLWSCRVKWNNEALDVAQTDGSLVYLYMHISQACALTSMALGRETKGSHQITHMCICLRRNTHRDPSWSNTTESLCSSYSSLTWSCLPRHNTETSRDDNSSLELFKGRN